jgi:hypothetical protein
MFMAKKQSFTPASLSFTDNLLQTFIPAGNFAHH